MLPNQLDGQLAETKEAVVWVKGRVSGKCGTPQGLQCGGAARPHREQETEEEEGLHGQSPLISKPKWTSFLKGNVMAPW